MAIASPPSAPPLTLADRMSRLGTESAFDVLAKVNKLKAEVHDMISFGLGEPDFDTPEHIKDAAIAAIQGNKTYHGPSAKLITRLLNDIDWVRCAEPAGAFYVLPNVTGLCKKLGLPTANTLCDFLLHEAGIAVLPRTCFGRRLEEEEYIRFSYATSDENIVEGLRRMKAAVER